MGDAAPLGYRRLTQESAIAATVALFKRSDDVQPSALAVTRNCEVLVKVLRMAEASDLLPNFIAAEFNDDDGETENKTEIELDFLILVFALICK
jgi:hypothetical protein